MVLPDGLLFNSDNSKVALKKKLMTECNLHTIIRLPSSVFAPYTSITTNLLFFDKTGSTKEIWYYRFDMPEGVKHFNKTKPIKRDDLKCVDEWWSNRIEIIDEKENEDSPQTYKAKKYTYKEIEENGFDLDLCGYPEEEIIVLSPEETIKNYKEHRVSLEAKLDEKLTLIMNLLEVKE